MSFRLAAFLLFVGVVLSPLRAAAARIPVLAVSVLASDPTATTHVDGPIPVRHEAEEARLSVYDEGLLRYDCTSNPREIEAPGTSVIAAQRYEGVLEHPASRAWRAEVSIYEAVNNVPAAGGGFWRGGIVAEEITPINRSLGGTASYADPSAAIAAAAARDGFYNKAAAMIRSIASGHTFDDANKRTAQAVYDLLRTRNGITTGISADETSRIIHQVASGELRDVDAIAKALRGFRSYGFES